MLKRLIERITSFFFPEPPVVEEKKPEPVKRKAAPKKVSEPAPAKPRKPRKPRASAKTKSTASKK